MSTAVDARRRPSLWSYISFSSSPRRRSISLPKPNQSPHDHDPHEKEDRHRNNGRANQPTGVVDNLKEAWMTPSSRSRYLKTGGIIAFIVLLFYFFAPRDGNGVTDLVTGMLLYWTHLTRTNVLILQLQAMHLQRLESRIRGP